MHGLIGRQSVFRVNVTITAIGSPPYDCTCELIGFSGRQPTSLSALWRAHRVHGQRGALNDLHGGCDKERAFRTVSPDDDHVLLLRGLDRASADHRRQAFAVGSRSHSRVASFWFSVTGSVAVGTTRDGQDATGRNAIVALSGLTCGLYRQNREFERAFDPFFKTTAIDHSAIPPAFAGVHQRACFGAAAHKPPAGRNRAGGTGKTRAERIGGLSPRMLLQVFRAVAQLTFELLLRPMVDEHAVHPASTGGVRIPAEHILVRGSHDRLRLLPRHRSTRSI